MPRENTQTINTAIRIDKGDSGGLHSLIITDLREGEDISTITDLKNHKGYELITTLHGDETQDLLQKAGLSRDADTKLQLGKGAFGAVLIVKNEAGDYFAVKKVELTKAAKNLDGYLDLLQENNIPNVIAPLETFQIKNKQGVETVYQIMPLAGFGNGEKFLQLLNDPRLSSEDRNNLFISSALSILTTTSEMHQNGLFHNDIKLANVLYDNAGKLFLADFDCAVYREGEALIPVNNTPGKEFQTDSQFVPPERWKISDARFRKEEALHSQHDDWRVGLFLLQTSSPEAALYVKKHLLVPGHLRSASADGVIAKHYEKHIQEIQNNLPKDKIPKELYEIIFGLLQVDPAKRIGVTEARQQLQSFLEKQPHMINADKAKEIFKYKLESTVASAVLTTNTGLKRNLPKSNQTPVTFPARASVKESSELDPYAGLSEVSATTPLHASESVVPELDPYHAGSNEASTKVAETAMLDPYNTGLSEVSATTPLHANESAVSGLDPYNTGLSEVPASNDPYNTERYSNTQPSVTEEEHYNTAANLENKNNVIEPEASVLEQITDLYNKKDTVKNTLDQKLDTIVRPQMPEKESRGAFVEVIKESFELLHGKYLRGKQFITDVYKKALVSLAEHKPAFAQQLLDEKFIELDIKTKAKIIRLFLGKDKMNIREKLIGKLDPVNLARANPVIAKHFIKSGKIKVEEYPSVIFANITNKALMKSLTEHFNKAKPPILGFEIIRDVIAAVKAETPKLGAKEFPEKYQQHLFQYLLNHDVKVQKIFVASALFQSGQKEEFFAEAINNFAKAPPTERQTTNMIALVQANKDAFIKGSRGVRNDVLLNVLDKLNADKKNNQAASVIGAALIIDRSNDPTFWSQTLNILKKDNQYVPVITSLINLKHDDVSFMQKMHGALKLTNLDLGPVAKSFQEDQTLSKVVNTYIAPLIQTSAPEGQDLEEKVSFQASRRI